MRKGFSILLGVVVLVYAAARAWRLTDACLWFDEIFSVHAAEHSWSGIIPFIAKDLIHPPLFYLLLKLWIGAGGESLLWLRLFPFLFALLALVPLWMLCRELKLRPSAVAAAFGLFAVNGALIKYSQEVRMYSLLLFLALVSTWLFSRFFFRGKSFWMLVLTNVFLVHSHYFGWFVVGAEVAAIAIAQRIKILQTLLMFGVTAAAFVPWLLSLARFAEPGSSVVQNIGWMERPGVSSVLDFALDVFDPFYFQQNSIEPAANYAIAAPMLILALITACVYIFRHDEDERSDRVVFLSVLAVTPLLLAFVLSWVLPVSIWGARHLLIVFAPVFLLCAVFLTGAKPAMLRRSLVAVSLALIGAGAFITAARPQEEPPWCAWEQLAREWASAAPDQPQTLYVFEDLIAYHFWFATRTDNDKKIVLIRGADDVPNDTAYFLPRGFDEVQTVDIGSLTENDIWISFRRPTAAPGVDERLDIAAFPPLNTLERLGYAVKDVRKDVQGVQTAYLVRLAR